MIIFLINDNVRYVLKTLFKKWLFAQQFNFFEFIYHYLCYIKQFRLFWFKLLFCKSNNSKKYLDESLVVLFKLNCEKKKFALWINEFLFSVAVVSKHCRMNS